MELFQWEHMRQVIPWVGRLGSQPRLHFTQMALGPSPLGVTWKVRSVKYLEVPGTLTAFDG